MDENDATRHYEIRVRGQLSERLAGAFPELHPRRRDHDTILSGVLADQSALHGVLGRIEGLGLELLEVRLPKSNSRKPTDRGMADPAAPRNSTTD